MDNVALSMNSANEWELSMDNEKLIYIIHG